MTTDIIFLTGFMGTGKSSVGKVLSGVLKRSFIDTDELIEKKAGKTIKEIFAHNGEDYFREIESSVLYSIKEEKTCVISTGGGLPTWKNNLEIMKEIGTVVALTANPQEILRRVSSCETVRPLLLKDNPLSAIISLLQKRAYYYIKSHILVETDGKNPAAVAEEIKTRLKI